MQSARNPEGVDITPNIVGVSVAISAWEEVTRGFFAKMLGRKDAGTETIALGGKQSVEVRNTMQGIRQAFLAWGKEAGVTFDEATIAKLFPENEGYEILGAENNLCLVHGKLEELVPKAPPIAAPQSKSKEGVHPYQQFIDEVEAKFAHRIKLADYPEGTHMPGLECLETEHAKRALAAFREAEAQGISQTELYLPKEVEGLASFILQIHAGWNMSEEVHLVQVELFRLLHILRKHKSIEHLFMESLRHGVDNLAERHGSFQQIRIPGTNLMLNSPEGQNFLFEHPSELLNLRRQLISGLDLMPVDSAHILLREQFPLLQGIEPPTSSKEQRQRYVELDKAQNAFYNKYSSSGDTFLRIVPQSQGKIIAGDRIFDKAELLGDLRNLLRTIEERERIMNSREEFAALRIKEVANFDLPHLVYGDGHRYTFLNRFSTLRLGVLMTKFSSLKKSDYYTYVHHLAGDANPAYAGARSVISKLEGAQN
jgi:hypothetical protein